ncbi:NF-kappa-B inhibitor zeta isoform X4 [Xiphophorus couchianus]|uniref:NF-kappa-B inhibitor zeta isoform X4 n=1 Tax=Xiphophorus couchianus TaxID=32473 RepID=UPI00101603AC|nr:NF-kappa-B inhibitor zeta-like isoform X4 [Xiphophorus couchianus]
MLDHGGSDLMAGGFMFDAKPQASLQHLHRKTTVKELLMMRRQKWNSEPKLKSPKYEPIAADMSPQTATSPTSLHLNSTACFFPALPENAVMGLQEVPQPVQPPAREHDVPASGGKMTLFHWQIQQEAKKAEGLSPEQVCMQDSDGDTFLHIAVAQGRRALSYVLATKMARYGSLDVKEHNGQTALQIAVATNQHLIISDLLSHGAQVNIRDLWGRSPLHVCAEKGHYLSLQSICKTLAGRGPPVDVEMFNYDGLTPLHAAVLSHNAVVKEVRHLENPCPFMISELAHRRRRYVECVRTLMHMGASYGTKDLKSGRTCLHMAAEEANIELLHLFLEQPMSLAAVNIKTFSGNTALHIVSSLQNYRNQAEAVKLLMRKGADPGMRNLENELPCQLVPEGSVGEKVRQILKGKYGQV